MNRDHLIARLQSDLGYSEAEAKRVVEALVESLTESLRQGEEISLPGVGVMEVVEHHNHGEGGESSKDVRFSPGKRLMDALTSLDFITKGMG